MVVGSEGKFPEVKFGNSTGLPSGTYRVALRAPDPRKVSPEVRKAAPANFGIAPKYMSPETSGITLQLDSDVEDFTITLDPPEKKDGVSADEAASMMEGGDE